MSGDGVAEAAGSSGRTSHHRPFLGTRFRSLSRASQMSEPTPRKLEFLRDLWPAEHIEHLAPRAALLVEGVAFQKVARLQASKLKTREGVQYLVESLGGGNGALGHALSISRFRKRPTFPRKSSKQCSEPGMTSLRKPYTPVCNDRMQPMTATSIDMTYPLRSSSQRTSSLRRSGPMS